jgi:hypothetical protein
MYNMGSFSDDDRDSCLRIIDTILECSNATQRYGVVALEEIAGKQGNEFLRFSLMLIIEGIDPQLVKGMLETLISCGNHTGLALLERIIITEGVLSIQAGENPHLIETKLLCCLGEKYLKERGHFPVPGGLKKSIDELLPQLIGEPLPEFNEFNETIQSLTDDVIRQVYTGIDQKELALVLKGCTLPTAKKLLGNLSNLMSSVILSDLEFSMPAKTSDISAVQNKMLQVIKMTLQK